jgi:putative heme transporter
MAVSVRIPAPWSARARAVIVRWRRWIWIIFGLAGLLLAARAVAGSRAELFAGVSSLRRVSWIWLGLAVVAEGCAFTALTFAQRRMLRAGGVSVGVGTLARLAVAGQAVGSVLPAGYLVSNVVVLRVLARRGVSQLLALWMLAIAGLLYIVTLLLIGLVGAQLASASKHVPDLRAGAAITLGVVIAVFVTGMTVARLRKHPWTVHELAARMPGGPLKRLIGGDVLANVSLGRKGWGVALIWMRLFWISDLTCLAIAFLAVAAALPRHGLLIAYAAGQFAALLPITPGGLGVAEGSMAVALSAYGVTATAVAAVLLYRLVAYWAILPAGGICYLSLRRRHSLVTPAPAAGVHAAAAQSPSSQATPVRSRVRGKRQCHEAVSTTGSPTRTRPGDATDPYTPRQP